MAINTNTKTAAKAIPINKAVGGKDRGTRYEATIDSIETTFYQTGSFGLKLKFVVAGLEKPVYNNIVLRKVGEDGNLEDTKYGAETFKRTLLAAGLTADEVNAIGVPNKKTTNEEFETVIGSNVAVYLAPREYMGKQYYDVKSVWSVDRN